MKSTSAFAALTHCVAAGWLARTTNAGLGNSGCSCSQCLLDQRSIFQRMTKPKAQPWLRTYQEIENGMHGRECAGCVDAGARLLPDWLVAPTALSGRATRDPWWFRSEQEIVNCCWRKLLGGRLLTDKNSTEPNELDYIFDYYGLVAPGPTLLGMRRRWSECEIRGIARGLDSPL
jgi:hypothetical protein